MSGYRAARLLDRQSNPDPGPVVIVQPGTQPERLRPDETPDPCERGARVRRAGLAKRTGRPWAAWWCPDRVKGCQPVWVDAELIVSPALESWQGRDWAKKRAAEKESEAAG